MRTPRLRSPLSAVAVALGLALVATACGGDDGGSSSTSVTIYSGRTENLIGPILDEFAEETGIDVRVRYGQSADLAVLLEEEAAAGQVQADVFLSQSPGAVGFLQAGDRLAAIPDDVLSLVPDTVRDPGGRWVGFSGRQRVFNYNPDLVEESELPDSVFDLTDPAWRGRIGISPSNGSFQDFVSTMRVTEGDDATREWLEAMAANDVISYPNNNAIVAAVGRGEIDAGLVNHYYNFRFMDENPDHPGRNHQLAADDPGSTLIVTAAAILEGAGNPDGAAELIAYLLGDSGQTYFAQETFEYPLAIGIEPVQGLPALDFTNIGSVDFSVLGDDLASTRQMITDAGLSG